MSTNTNTGTARLAAGLDEQAKKNAEATPDTAALVEQTDELAAAMTAWADAVRPNTETKESDK